MKNRVAYLDISKFIAIFFMVLCHTLVPRTLDSIVHAFHMPIFFIISGWCFNIDKHNKFLPFIRSRIKSLLIPYFFWGTVLFLGWELFYLLYDPQKTFSATKFLSSFFYDNALSSPFATIQWFLTCMFFAQIIGWLLLTLCKKRTLLVIASIILLFVIGWGLPFVVPFRLPLSLDVAISSGGFYLCGWLIPNCITPKINDKVKKILLCPATLIVELVLGLYIAYINGYVNMRLISFNNPLLFYLSAILLSLAIMHFSYLFERFNSKENFVYKSILYLGKNTLLILMLNQVFIQSAKLIVENRGFYVNLSQSEKYLLWFGFSVVLMVLFIPVIMFINRFIPFSTGKFAKRIKQ